MKPALWTISWLLVLSLLAVSTLVMADGDDKKPKRPYRSKEEALKLCVAEFVDITPGKGKFPASFQMGSAKPNEGPVHEVKFARPFAISSTEVTQELYQAVTGTNPSKWKGARNAVEMVTWDEANAFCAALTKELHERKLLAADEKIRLATEAEWEYACRAGTKSNYSFGDNLEDLGKYCWFKGNSKGFDPPVGEKAANPWGLYDMHGYNWEWVLDDWSPSYEGAPADGSASRAAGGKEKIIRGGSWADPADSARSAYRQPLAPGVRNDKVGFRCVRAKF